MKYTMRNEFNEEMGDYKASDPAKAVVRFYNDVGYEAYEEDRVVFVDQETMDVLTGQQSRDSYLQSVVNPVGDETLVSVWVKDK